MLEFAKRLFATVDKAMRSDTGSSGQQHYRRNGAADKGDCRNRFHHRYERFRLLHWTYIY